MTDIIDNSKFPNETYKDTVLEPLFNASKRTFADYHFRVNLAHAVMLKEQKILSEEQASAILTSLIKIEEGLDIDALEYTGEVEDYFFYVEGELIKELGADLAGRLHTGRSRNDIDHTIFKMRLMDLGAVLLTELNQLISTLLAVGEREKTTIILAYTHGQPAQPTTWGHYLGSFIEMLQRDVDRISTAMKTVEMCSMGAAAITTTGFNLNRNRMADLLGFACPLENSYGCISSIDYVTGLYSAMKVMFLNMGRFIQDLAQRSSFETGHLYVPNEFVQISSIMPQKRNPVPIEHMRLMASLSAGHCDTIVNTMHNTPMTDMNDSETEVQEAGHKAFESGTRLIKLLNDFIGAVQIDEKRIEKHIDESCATITEVADSIARIEGIPFREAHEIAAKMAKIVVSEGGSLGSFDHDNFKKIYKDSVGEDTKISADRLKEIASPAHFIAVRKITGGPAIPAFEASLKKYTAVAIMQSNENVSFFERLIGARENLAEAVKEITG
ncbi:argininosuccinate lyase [Pseudemcibacter aquimaris]|uniref:argininosuccinate lyase n=1 Tax=Pseudemcibacter aquimaris TaxID=2857064 RepID=UPI0020128338|nr:argininosuccinate lyase [Pseudemcibacter aquimaris]MCC3861141.1 argininosuccinate lyase [Pseudemcibacter aquimaris]WDU59958.1 argininosuccinate lyase [Pseudemcibacter aquimaris]